MRLPEIEKSVQTGKLQIDGKIVLNDVGELAVTKGIALPKSRGNGSGGRASVAFTRCCCSIWD